MKKLTSEEMVTVEGGIRPTPRTYCIVSGVATTVIGAAMVLSGAGTLFGIGTMFAGTASVMACGD